MTVPAPEQPAKAPPFAVTAPPGSRLEELLASYEDAKAAAESAAERYKAITDGIKAEIAAACPESTVRATLTGMPGMPRLKLTWVSQYRFDSRRFKDEHPEIYVKYEKQNHFLELRQL